MPLGYETAEIAEIKYHEGRTPQSAMRLSLLSHTLLYNNIEIKVEQIRKQKKI